MLKQIIKDNLVLVIKTNLDTLCGDEILAYDLAKQCVSEEDAQLCLDKMLEHISEKDLMIILRFLESDYYLQYLKALDSSVGIIKNKVEDTLRLLTEPVVGRA